MSSAASRFYSLDQWLTWIERQHARAVDLSLDRVRAVAAALDLRLESTVVTVGGTNGKGSTSAMLESVLRSAGYRTGLYTSPHLLRYNERVRLDGVEASDLALCEGFEAVEAARGKTPLTYFEYGTLAGMWVFVRSRPDVVILEVGLGGRLDAVNIVDAEVSALTAIGLDHTEYLGPTREDIGREKAGIFRAGRPAICGEPDPPASVLSEAARIGADLRLIDRDFGYVAEPAQWLYWSAGGRRAGLPLPALRGRYQLANAATALATLDALRDRLPVPAAAIRNGLLAVRWPARFQVLPGVPTVILDVAHNPHAARALAGSLQSLARPGRTFAVAGILADKDAEGIGAALAPQVDRWFAASLAGPRGRSAAALRTALTAGGIDPGRVSEHPDPVAAYRAACEQAEDADKIIVFGSFLTVASVIEARRGRT